MLKYYSTRVLLSLVVSFVTLEIGLQIASIVLPSFLVRSDDGQVQAYDLIVLCVGDPHTFGARFRRRMPTLLNWLSDSMLLMPTGGCEW